MKKKAKNNLVRSTFWLCVGLFWYIAHNLMHLCQIKLGMERNTTPNDLN